MAVVLEVVAGAATSIDCAQCRLATLHMCSSIAVAMGFSASVRVMLVPDCLQPLISGSTKVDFKAFSSAATRAKVPVVVMPREAR